MALLHSPRIVTDGLVLCLDAANRESYPGSGNVWRDLAGSNNGTLINGVGFNAANNGGLTFDGTDDYVNLTNTNNLNITTGDFSLETFLYYQRASSNFARVASRGSFLNPGWVFYAGFDGTNDAIGIQFGTTSWNAMVRGITRDNWYHACLTRLNGVIFIYINGIMRGSLVSNYNFNSTAATLIGVDGGGGQFFKGNIYTFRQYNRGLTPAEILQNYNALKGRYNL